MLKASLIGVSLFVCVGVLALPVSSLTRQNTLVFGDEAGYDAALVSLQGKPWSWVLWRGLARAVTPFYAHQSYRVQLTWPLHIEVSIQERIPWLITLQDGGSVFVDREGCFLYPNAGRAVDDQHLLAIRGLEPTVFEHQKLSSDLLAALAQYDAQLKHYWPENTRLLQRLSDDSWQLLLDDQLIIYLGELTNLDTKATRIAYGLKHARKQNRSVLYMDVRMAGKLVIKHEEA